MTDPVQTEKPARWPLILMVSLMFVAVLSVAAWNVELPYLAYSAGPVSDAADNVVADGVEVYPPKGELLMLTAIHQDVNIFEAIIAGFDPTVDLAEKQTRRRVGETDEQYRNRVLQQMSDSNFRAVAVALDYLGYEMIPSEVVINEFVEGAPAGDVLELGDTIIGVAGRQVESVEDIGAALAGLEPGDVVSITVGRAGSLIDVDVELTSSSEDPDRVLIGIVPGVLTQPPFPLSIDAGDVGGPSAGMMHTIAIIDTLTEGELTKGRVIAGTGTINLDGTIGRIGNVRQKVVGAEAAGAEYMLVPAGNYEVALTAERDDIVIVPVSTLQEAIEFLEGLDTA